VSSSFVNRLDSECTETDFDVEEPKRHKTKKKRKSRKRKSRKRTRKPMSTARVESLTHDSDDDPDCSDNPDCRDNPDCAD
jgi:hypothetical protein